MPAVTPAAKTEKEEKLWIALKRHILKERLKLKQELEAEVEEERLRKEREAREKQDVMTLGETREQIQLLDDKLSSLRNEKQQLFLQLKKVLNEDDNRKKQMRKETTEIYPIQVHGGHSQIFLPPRVPHQQQVIHKGNPPATISNNMKRTRSPSPNSLYFNQLNNSQHYPQMEEGRRTSEPRVVLWNKSPQYTNAPGTLFYPSINAQPDSRGQSIIYPNYPGNINMPLRQYGNSISPPPQNHSQQQMQSKNDTSKGSTQSNMYHINLEQQQSVQQHKSHPSQGQPISIEKISDRYHMEMKHDDRKDVRFSHGQAQPPPQGPPPTQQHLGDLYSSLRPLQLPLHSIPLQQNTQGGPKPGSITQGYPRGQQQPQQQPPPASQMHYARHRY